MIVLNHNGREHLAYGLPSVLATDFDDMDVLVVDNGSTDESVAMVRAQYPQVEVIGLEHNLGWAAGNNVGVKRAMTQEAEYVALLNNDVRVDPRWLANAVEAADRDPSVGVVGFNTIGEYHVQADPEQVLFGQAQAAWDRLEVRDAEHIAGCAVFLRVQLFHDIGLFDERFFAYSEDDDLQKRALRAGYRIVRTNIPLWHHNGAYWNERRALRASLLAQRNRIREMLKNESLGMALRRFWAMVRFVCAWAPDYERSHADLRRMRPSAYPVNLAILGYAMVWNAVMLPGTLRSRMRDERRIERARRRRKATT